MNLSAVMQMAGVIGNSQLEVMKDGGRTEKTGKTLEDWKEKAKRPKAKAVILKPPEPATDEIVKWKLKYPEETEEDFAVIVVAMSLDSVL